MICMTGCKKDNGNKVISDYPEFMAMNLFQTEEFSLLPYYPIKDIRGHENRLDSIFQQPKLVFRFSGHNCETCIESEVRLIKELKLSENVVGFASYDNLRMLKLAQTKYNIQFPIYYLPLGQECILPESKEELGRPYLFIMGHDLHAKHIFFPSMKHPEMSKKYYQEVFYLLNDTNAAEDIFSQKMIDLGTITKGKTYEARFKYSNRTTDRLVLTDVKTSCGCTVPQWDKRPLDKDKSSDLVVLFTPETLGYSSKFVMVSHNKSDYPVRLIIKANVE